MRERGTALARRGEDTVGTGLPHMVVQLAPAAEVILPPARMRPVEGGDKVVLEIPP